MALFGINPQTRREQGMTAAAVVAVLLAVVHYMYVFSPKQEELATVESRVEALDAANAQAKRDLAKGSVDELRARAVQYAADLELMRQLVPTSNEVPALLEQVSTAARRVNLDIGSVVPEPVVAGEQFDTYRYRLTVVGGYHALGEFLANVGSLTRIVAPVNLKLAPATNQSPAAARGRAAEINSEFEIETYVARKTPGSAASASSPSTSTGPTS
jgi:type IV pilus assembly protein PilO